MHWYEGVDQSSKPSHEVEVQAPLPTDQTSSKCRKFREEQSTSTIVRSQDVSNLLRRHTRGEHWWELGTSQRLQKTLLEQSWRRQLNGRSSHGTQGQYDLRCVFWRPRLACLDSMQHRRKHHANVSVEASSSFHFEVRSWMEIENCCALGWSFVPSIYWNSQMHSVPGNEGRTECSLFVSDSSSWALVCALQTRRLQWR